MGLLDILQSQTPQGQDLRSGLLHAGIGMLAGSYGNYGAFMPALAGGAAGYAQGTELAQQRRIQDEETKWRREQAEQMRAFRELQMMGTVQEMQQRQRENAMRDEAAGFWSGGGASAPSATMPATASAPTMTQAFPVSEIGAPPAPTVPTVAPGAPSRVSSGFSMESDPEYQQIMAGMNSRNPYVQAEADRKYKVYMERLKNNPDYIAQQEAAKIAAKSQAEREATEAQNTIDAGKRRDLYAESKEHLAKASNGTLNSILTRGLEMIGISTEASQADAILSTIAGSLVGYVPRFSGPQSDKDVALYQQMAGNIANSSLPVATRMATVERLEKWVAEKRAAGEIADDGVLPNAPRSAAPTSTGGRPPLNELMGF